MLLWCINYNIHAECMAHLAVLQSLHAGQGGFTLRLPYNTMQVYIQVASYNLKLLATNFEDFIIPS